MSSLYAFTVPIFIKSLGGLKLVIQKAQAHGLDEHFMGSSLAPDMFPFVRQVQIACDNAKGTAARLAGIENPVFEDTESSFEQLEKRIDATISFLESIPPSAYDDAEERQVTLPYFPGKYMLGYDYVREYALPNFFFHVSIAYALVRQAGAPVGKADYINGMQLKDLS